MIPFGSVYHSNPQIPPGRIVLLCSTARLKKGQDFVVIMEEHCIFITHQIYVLITVIYLIIQHFSGVGVSISFIPVPLL